MKNKSVRFLCIGGLMTALTVILQGAQTFIGEAAIVAAPLSTFTILMAAVINAKIGFIAYISSFILLMSFNPEEALILLTTTGVLGLSMGLSYNKNWLVCMMVSGFSLSIGMSFLCFIIGFPALGPLVKGFSLTAFFLICLFTLVYSAIIYLIARIIFQRFLPELFVKWPPGGNHRT